MTDKTYTCHFDDNDILTVHTYSGYEKTTLVRGRVKGDSTDVYLSQKDAEDMAWSILESYGTATRPPQPQFNVGDLVMVNNAGPHHRRFGRITGITGSDEFTYRVKFPENGRAARFYDHELNKITEMQLRDYAKRLAENTINGEF